jgi:hypothetical protein
MPDYNVLGKNVLVEMLIDGVYFKIFCAKSADQVIDQDEIETTHVNSGANREYVPGMSNSVINMQGMTRINNEDGRINAVYLMQTAIRRDIWPLRVTLTNENAQVATLSFNAFIKSVGWSRESTSFSNSSVSWRVTGDITFATSVPAPTEPVCEVQDPLYLTLAEGEISTGDPLLDDPEVTILAVTREGVGYDETTGTPVYREFRHVGEDIVFDASLPGNPGGETVYVLYKKVAVI